MPEIHIDLADKREDLPDFDILTPCPRCGPDTEITEGFGLAGGGFGPYTYCVSCLGIVTKSCEPDE